MSPNKSDRDQVFAALKKANAPNGSPTPYPEFEDEVALCPTRLSDGSLRDSFDANLKAVNGRSLDSIEGLSQLLKEKNCVSGYCDPALRQSVGSQLEADFSVSYAYERDEYETYSFGITRATGAIAETGTLILTDSDTSHRLAALSPWIHIACLSEQQIHRSVAEAIAAFGEEGNIIWATGPSKTADIEGILIEGVHGPGEEVAFFIP